MSGRFAGLLAALAAAALLCGCGNIDVSGLVAPEAPTSIPTVTASASYHAPPEDDDRLGNLAIDVYTARGVKVRISDATAAGMLLQAMGDKSLRFESGAKVPMDNIVVLRDADNREIARMTVASDGDHIAQPEGESNFFTIPEWIYYQIEYYLWMKDASLYAKPLTWAPEDGDGPLMLRIETMLHTLLPQAYGYADAYVSSFKVYGIHESSYQVKVYLLVAYAGYIRDGDAFRQQFQRITPVALTLYRLPSNEWRYIAYQEPKASKEGKIEKSAVRAIFPFEYTEQAMEDLSDPGSLPDDLVHKARDWLRERGLGDLTIAD
ncbi:MAG: hypothetical protein ACOX7W_06705 [Christensenellales bacterium]